MNDFMFAGIFADQEVPAPVKTEATVSIDLHDLARLLAESVQNNARIEELLVANNKLVEEKRAYAEANAYFQAENVRLNDVIRSKMQQPQRVSPGLSWPNDVFMHGPGPDYIPTHVLPNTIWAGGVGVGAGVGGMNANPIISKQLPTVTVSAIAADTAQGLRQQYV